MARKRCPSCNQPSFECCAGGCWCDEVPLTPEMRAELRERYDDCLCQGWPIHHVQEMLGCASLEQTSTYLNVTRVGLHESMRLFECDASRCTPVVQSGSVEHSPAYNAAAKHRKQLTVN